jgi:hypothetical protein
VLESATEADHGMAASDDIFHIIGFTSQNILDGSQMKLTGLGHAVLKRNEELWRQVGPLVAAAQAGKITRNVFEVYSITPFLFGSDDVIPPAISNLGGGPYLAVEFLNDEALKLCSEYGIKLPPVLGKIKRAELPPPPHLGITTKGVIYRRP